MARDELLAQINKRITLNLLIEGCAQHASLTAHHLVRDELAAIDRDLLLLYDQYALAGIVQYWTVISKMICGTPHKFWARARSQADHPFYRHKLLAQHGGVLAEASRQRAVERCKTKGVRLIPVVFSFQLTRVHLRIMHKEARHRPALVELAKRSTQIVWGISPDRMEGELCDVGRRVEFGDLARPATFTGKALRHLVVGYGGVIRRDGELVVMAKGRNWPVLSHELVKGALELICMHGLNELDDETYAQVVTAADRIDYEPWLLQAGPELWRRLLPLLPDGRAVADVMMHVARLPPAALEALMLAVLEKPEWARELLATVGTAKNDANIE